MAYTKYSLTPSSNTAAPPDGAPEGMLPSAVNDTMRDMMAQIRDCGDGIRDGTYTMTAPKITGGTITGSTINNSAIGGTTAAAGKFTTLEATGATTFSGATVVSASLTANTFSSSGATITGGSVTGITDLAIADGGTGASTAAGARTNLGLDGFVNMKNRIINGAMVIDQRNAGASVSLAAGADQYTLDRYDVQNNTTSGAFTCQQVSTAPAGFINSMKITVTATEASPTSTMKARIYQAIEGLNVADLGWGTANAKTVTLSFWVQSSVTGTFGGSLGNASDNRAYPFTYTISAANTWEQKSVTIAGDTTGTWATNNTTGILLNISLLAGTSRSGTAGAWNSNWNTSATGATNLLATNGATFYITGVQLEVGSTATSFDYRPYGTELALCLRYYWRVLSTGGNAPIASGNAENTTRGYINLTLPQPMRTQATCSISNISHLALRGGGTDVTCTSGNFAASTSSAMATIIGGEFNTGSSTGASSGGCVKMVWNNASGWIDASAEL